MIRMLFTTITFLFFSIPSQAQQQVQQQATQTVPGQTSSTRIEKAKAESPGSLLNGSVSFEYATNTQEYGNFGKSESVSLILAPNLNIGGGFSIGVLASLSDETNSPNPTRAGNTRLTLSIPQIKLGEKVSISTKAHGYAPTDTIQYKDESYRGSVEAESQIALATSLINTPFTISYKLGGRFNFHQFDRSNTGAQNENTRATHRIAAGVSPFGFLSINLEGAYIQGITYLNRIKERFAFTESITAEITKSLSISAGHTNGGSLFGPDGKTSNVSAYDERQSTYFGTITYGF